MIFVFLKYCIYKLFARHRKGHGIHSPFTFEFIQNILNNKIPVPQYHLIKAILKDLKAASEKITVTDFGAGSKILKGNTRKIKNITKSSAIHSKYGKVLNRMVAYYKYRTVVELGTSFGIGSLYLTAGNHNSRLITIEGCPSIANIAIDTFSKAGFNHITLINKPFDEAFETVLSDAEGPLMVYIDGNHRFEPTIKYFNQCMSYFNSDSILVIGDIHWSKEMEKAWKAIKYDDRVKVSIDLFHLGILFFREGLSKEEFVVGY